MESHPPTASQADILRAQSRLEELQNKIQEFISTYSGALQKGGINGILEKITTDLKSSRENLENASDAFRTGSHTDIPAEKILQLLASSLQQVETVMHRIQRFDMRAQLPETLVDRTQELHVAAVEAIDAAHTRLREWGTQAGILSEQTAEYAKRRLNEARALVQSNSTLQAAFESVDRLRARVTELEVVQSAKDILHRATAELKHSVEALRDVPATEVPFVAISESLKLARNAINTSSAIITRTATTQKFSAPVVHGLQKAYSMAADSIRRAMEALHTMRDQIWTNVVHVADVSQNYVLQKAAEMDAQYGVIDNTTSAFKSIDSTLGLSNRYDQICAKSKEYGLEEKVSNVLSTAKSVDSRITNGRVQHLSDWMLDCWKDGQQYASTLQQQFLEKRNEASKLGIHQHTE